MRYFIVSIVALFFSSALFAQVRVNINFNVDSQPVWGPTGYDYVEYYYLPDIEVYYYVPQHRYYYYENGIRESQFSFPQTQRWLQHSNAYHNRDYRA